MICAEAFVKHEVQAQQSVVPVSPTPTVTIDRTAEFRVKGVYLYNFARSIEWPAASELPTDSFVIGVVGKSPVTATLQSIASKRSILNKRTETQQPLVVKEFSSVIECTPCHLIFISETFDSDQVPELLQRFDALPVLFVGETPRFASSGGGAELVVVDGGVRFNLNLKRITERKLKIDARLLRAANEIYDESVVGTISRK